MPDRAPKRGPTLRNVLSGLTLATVALALVLTGGVIALTTHSTRVSHRMEDALEAVRLAERAEIDLLLLDCHDIDHSDISGVDKGQGS